MDIITSIDPNGGGYVINSFTTGEWLAYTVNVASSGQYTVALRASNNYTAAAAAFHVGVDNVAVTASIKVPVTGGWATFQPVTTPAFAMSAGKHVLKIVSDQQYFNLNSITVAASGSTTTPPPPTPTPTPTPAPGTVAFSCTFPSSVSDCGFGEQSYNDLPRATIANIGRDGGTALRLHTNVGDNNVLGSGTWERDDVMLSPSSSYCNAGQEEWWANSMLFPSDYVFPPGPEAGIIMDFHHNYSSGQANFEVGTIPGVGLRMRGYGGSTINGGQYQAVVADPYGASLGVTKNVWYDFVYHTKWSSGSDGLMVAWLNGKKVLTYNGPTLYSGISCYLKLANYHAAFGQPSSIIYDRVICGTTAAAVALTPLEGVK